MSSARTAIPLTILSGFLGAGKTTLLNHVLRQQHGRRIAVIVNDFGSINIDQELISSRDGETISLANGCVCCAMGDRLMETLLNLLRQPQPPEHLIIEASGVSDPWNIAAIGISGDAFALDGIITLVDAESVRDQAEDKYVGETVLRQLSAADIIVLNKLDLVSMEQKEALHGWLAGVALKAHVIDATHAMVDPVLLLGIDSGRIGTDSGLASSGCDAHGHAVHQHDRLYRSWSMRANQPFNSQALRAAIGSLPGGVIRAKGVLHLDDAPARRTFFQLVGRRWSLSPGPEWNEAPPGSQLVFIAPDGCVDGDAVLARFRSALAPIPHETA